MLYLITRTDRHDYDEYDEIVVRAGSEKEARELVCRTDKYGESLFRGFRPDGTNAKVTKIDVTGDAEVICTSFNAG